MISGVDYRLQARLVEQFLMNLEGVMDASTWFDNNELRAQVTVIPHRNMTYLNENDLIEICKKDLGANNAPKSILVLIAKPRAVIRAA
jgi:hypothetical protein